LCYGRFLQRILKRNGKYIPFATTSVYTATTCFPAMLPEKYRIAGSLADFIGALIQNSG
jgi:hypothetical protein